VFLKEAGSDPIGSCKGLLQSPYISEPAKVQLHNKRRADKGTAGPKIIIKQPHIERVDDTDSDEILVES
jgi:hypothetical protein